MPFQRDIVVTLNTLIAIKEVEELVVVITKTHEDLQSVVLISETTLCLLQVLVMKKSLSFILLTNRFCHIKVQNPFSPALKLVLSMKIMDLLHTVTAIILMVETEAGIETTVQAVESFTA
jgi:hypothetical protein